MHTRKNCSSPFSCFFGSSGRMGSCTDYNSPQLYRPSKVSLFATCTHPDELAVPGTVAYSRALHPTIEESRKFFRP